MGINISNICLSDTKTQTTAQKHTNKHPRHSTHYLQCLSKVNSIKGHTFDFKSQLWDSLAWKEQIILSEPKLFNLQSEPESINLSEESQPTQDLESAWRWMPHFRNLKWIDFYI